MDYVVQNATEIMQLCFGFGFLLFVVLLIRPIMLMTRLLKKADDLSDLFIEYIQKPLRAGIKIYHAINDVMGFFKKD